MERFCCCSKVSQLIISNHGKNILLQEVKRRSCCYARESGMFFNCSSVLILFHCLVIAIVLPCISFRVCYSSPLGVVPISCGGCLAKRNLIGWNGILDSFNAGIPWRRRFACTNEHAIRRSVAAIIITRQKRRARMSPPSERTSSEHGSCASSSPGGADVGPGGH